MLKNPKVLEDFAFVLGKYVYYGTVFSIVLTT